MGGPAAPTKSPNKSPPPIPPPAKPSLDLPTLSPEELHLYLLKAFTIGNRAKRKLIDGLLHLHESRFYLLLGYSSIFQYAEKFSATSGRKPTRPSGWERRSETSPA